MLLSTALLTLLFPNLMPDIVHRRPDLLLRSHQSRVLLLFHQILERDGFLWYQILLWNSDFHSILQVFCMNFGTDLLICSIVDVVLH